VWYFGTQSSLNYNMRTLIKNCGRLRQPNINTHINRIPAPSSQCCWYRYRNSCHNDWSVHQHCFRGGRADLWSIYEIVSKNNLFAMFVGVNLSMIVANQKSRVRFPPRSNKLFSLHGVNTLRATSQT
jgi:hypothetical protein